VGLDALMLVKLFTFGIQLFVPIMVLGVAVRKFHVIKFDLSQISCVPSAKFHVCKQLAAM
jgi:hypothetical protein